MMNPADRRLPAVLAGVLLFVGWLLYHEAMTWNKLVGIVICLIGEGLILRRMTRKTAWGIMKEKASDENMCSLRIGD